MVDGIIQICDHCGGEVDIRAHLHDAHLAEDGDGFAHLVWSHVRCGRVDETPISAQDYKSALSILKRDVGREVAKVESEGDELLRQFRVDLRQIQTPGDIGAWT